MTPSKKVNLLYLGFYPNSRDFKIGETTRPIEYREKEIRKKGLQNGKTEFEILEVVDLGNIDKPTRLLMESKVRKAFSDWKYSNFVRSSNDHFQYVRRIKVASEKRIIDQFYEFVYSAFDGIVERGM